MAKWIETNEQTGGSKGRGRAQMSLIPHRQLMRVAERYGKGAEQYEARNWEKGYNWSWSYDALQRHLAAFWGYQQNDTSDAETEHDHLAAAAFHVLALMEFLDAHQEFDDRPSRYRHPDPPRPTREPRIPQDPSQPPATCQASPTEAQDCQPIGSRHHLPA